MSQSLWLQNLAAYSAQVALLVVSGGLLPALFRLKMPRLMLAYWQTLLAVCLMLPLAETWKPLPPPQATTLVTIPVETLPVGARPAAPALPLPGSKALALLLALGMVGRLGRLALGLERLRRYRRRARRLFPLPPTVKEVTSLLGLDATFYVSDETDGPITFGKLNPAVLFPPRFLGMDASAQRAIACHELVHVERRDWVWNLAEELILALLWFHPALWWLVSRIRLTREQVVDIEVLRLTRERKPYLNALLEIASGGPAPSAAAAPLFLGERQLAERVVLMVKEVSMSKSRLALCLTAVCGLFILTTGIAVWSFPLKAPAREPASSVTGGIAGGIRGGIESGLTGGISGGIPGGVKGSVPENGQSQTLKPVRTVPPVYPPLAKQARVQGDVKLRLHVNAGGEVDDVEVLSGEPLLTKAAVDAARQWRYADDSVLLPATTDVTLTFSLDDMEKKPEAAEDKKAGSQSAPDEAATLEELLRKQIEETRSSLLDSKELEALRKAIADSKAATPNPKELEALRKAMAEAKRSMPTDQQLRAYREALKEAESNMAKAEQLRAYQETLKENDKALKEYQAAAEKSAQEPLKEYQNALKEYEAAARKSAEENDKALKEYQAVARKLAEAASNRANGEAGPFCPAGLSSSGKEGSR